MNRPISVYINGITGRMGQSLQKALEHNEKFALIGGSSLENPLELSLLEKAELIIDFSSPKGTALLLEKAVKLKTPRAFLICTTGLSQEDFSALEKLREKHRVLHAPNTSIGIALLLRTAINLALATKDLDFDIELTETHHKHKKDAPSGTALLLADAMAEQTGRKIVTSHPGLRHKDQIGVHSLRGGGVFGEHTIRFISESEEVSISHRAFSRDLFARGAFVLGEWLVKQEVGFYQLEDINL